MEKISSGNLMLVLTNECNLNCSYCYERNKKKSVMTFDIAKREIECLLQDKKYETLTLSFFGGEPFLEFELMKKICLWIWANSSKKIYLNVITNGSTLKKNEKEWLQENRKKINVMLSLDGTPETQNRNRCGSFDQIDIPFFKENWPDVGVKMTISNQSLKNLCEDVKFVHSLNLKIAECNLAFGIDWSDKNNVKIFAKQMEALYRYYKDNIELKFAEIINMAVEACENERKILKICNAGESRYVDTDGSIYPCNYINPLCFSKKDLFFLMNVDFENIEELEDMECFETCYIYPLCPNCYAANYSLSGQLNKRNRAVCKINKVRAYYSALLLFEKIRIKKINNLTELEKGFIHKQLIAIKKIVILYDDFVKELVEA